MVVVPIRTGNGLNAREHWRARARRTRLERDAVRLMLTQHMRPAIPCVIWMTRIAPSRGLDSDNLAGSLKAVRDQVAEWLGVDDRDHRVEYYCRQERGPWGVRIEWMTRMERNQRWLESVMESF